MPKVIRPGWHDYWLGVAEAISARADCTRRQVGAVIVNHNRIISTGYNGGEAGGRSCLKGECPRGRFLESELPGFDKGNSDYSTGDNYCVAIHAEINALLYADRTRVEGGILYVTCPPCGECEKIIGNSGLKYICFPSQTDGVKSPMVAVAGLGNWRG